MLVSVYLYALPSKISSLVCYEKLWLKGQQLILDEVFLYSWLTEYMTQVHKQAMEKSQKFPDEHMCAGVCVESAQDTIVTILCHPSKAVFNILLL